MSNFLRGGQVLLHKLRMHGQLGRTMLRGMLVIGIAAILYSYQQDISRTEWQIGNGIIKAEIIGLFNEDKVIEHVNQHGWPIQSKVKDFKNYYYVKQTASKFERTLYKGLLLATLIISSAVLLVTISFFWMGWKMQRTKRLRGVFLTSSSKLRSMINNHNRPLKRLYNPFKIAGLSYPITGGVGGWSAGEQSHTLLVASTGAGKTEIIKQLVFQLHQRKQKAIIVDVKGDYIKHFHRKGDIVLNPLDARGRNWSFFNETNALKGFMTIAKSLIPKDSKNDPIWTEAARAVLAEMASMYSNEKMPLSEFVDIILKSDLASLSQLLQKSSAAKLVNTSLEKAALSVLMVLSTYLRPLKLYRESKEWFSITDWVKDDTQNNFLFISTRADAKQDINPLVSTQVDIAITALKSLSESSNVPKVWFILDEVNYFDHGIPSLKDGLTTARSYGGCFVLGTQDISSLRRIYSREEAETIANNCRTKLFLNIAGHDTALWASESLGEGEIEEWHENISYGAHEMRDGMQVSKSKKIQRVVLASEFSLLKAGEGYIQFAGYTPAHFKSKRLAFNKIAESYVENMELYSLFRKEILAGQEHRQRIEEQLRKKADYEDVMGSTTDKIAAAPLQQVPVKAGIQEKTVSQPEFWL